MTWRRACVLAAGVALLLGGCGDERPAAPSPQQARDRSLVRTLRAGGLVLVMRHTAADTMISGEESLSSCGRQRALTVVGREQARAIGRAITRLELPIGEIRASPMCRARDTAQLMLGRATVDRDLITPGVIGTDAGDERRTQRLLALAQTPPKAGTDSLLVTHVTNIGNAVGLSADEGELLAFRPDPGQQRPRLVARLQPEDWARLASVSR
jgi:phosphohistidine phosphatase SixA